MSEQNLRDEIILINGLNVRYLEAGSGRPTLFLHSLNPRSCAEEWIKDMDLYARSGCHIYALDMPGWGLSDFPKGGQYNFELWIDVVKGFCDALSLDRVDIVGRTLGGWIAALFAHQYPERVGSMVLFNNAGLNPRPPLSYGTLSTMPDLDSLKATFKNESLAEKIHARLHQPGKAEEFQLVLQYVLDPQVRDAWSLRTRLSEVHVPVLFAMRDNAGEMASKYAIEGFTMAPRGRLFVTKGSTDSDSAEGEIAKAAVEFLADN